MPTLSSQVLRKAWLDADPSQFIDIDQNRYSISDLGLFAADAVVSLALAIDDTIRTGLINDLEHSSYFRKSTFEFINNVVRFNGTTGELYYKADATRGGINFRFIYSTNDSWNTFANFDIDLDPVLSDSVLYPDGSESVFSSANVAEPGNYTYQLAPYCSSGQESSRLSSDPPSYACVLCASGKYKYEAGYNSCQMCPTGSNCTYLSTTEPCVYNGFWRDPHAFMNDSYLLDYHKYPIYSCDYSDACLGTCLYPYNESCALGYKQSSPTCAVCQLGYYLADLRCKKCKLSLSKAKSAVDAMISVSVILLVGFLYVFFSHSLNKVSSSQSSDNPLSFVLKNMHYGTTTAKQLLSHFQILTAAFSQSSEVDWPNSLVLNKSYNNS
jgi:hypothetical protein